MADVLTASSDVQTDGSKNLVSVSDERLKTFLGDLKVNAIEKINGIVPKRFRWDSDVENGVDAEQLGFFAQNVHQYIPEAAPFDTDRAVYGFNLHALCAYLVRAIQELDKKVEERAV